MKTLSSTDRIPGSSQNPLSTGARSQEAEGGLGRWLSATLWWPDLASQSFLPFKRELLPFSFLKIIIY